ncbi:MAG: ABC transporter substrate-binding protein [Burkholderiales bacterium]|nr:MAG: ABC transporter substrate-binding protein [Burkholderiales bacterium]
MPPARLALICRLLAGLWAAAGLGAALAAPPLRMLVYPVPGLFDVADSGSISGPGGVLLDKIARASEQPFDTVSLPMARAWSTLLTDPTSCVLGLSRKPDREARLQWVGPVSRADFIVYGRSDAPSLAPELAALQGKAVVVLRETVPASELRELGVAAQEVTNTLNALRMLQAGRADYWYAHQIVAESAASAAGGPPIMPLFSTHRIDGYLACHPGVPAAAVERLRQALQKLRRHGDLADFGLR